MSSPAVPLAHWPLPSLLRSLARAGWGDLGGSRRGARIVLRGLSDLLPDGSARGLTTAAQLADVTGYSKRWVEHQLRELEAQGLITWERGGIAYGKPRPSLITVVKSRIVDLITRARPELAERVEARRRATAERLANLPPFLRVRRGRRRSVHAEVATTPHPTREVPRRTSPWTVTTNDCHGYPNGAERRPKDGQLRCPICRNAEKVAS